VCGIEMDVRILNCDIRWRSDVSFTSLPLCSDKYVTSVHAGVVSWFFSDGPQNTWLFPLYEPGQCLMARISKCCKVLIWCDLN
jgi:hypothetical protein